MTEEKAVETVENKLTCTKVIRKDDGKDMQGRPIIFHEKCGRPAAEVEVGGLLTKAKAILCGRCKVRADNQAFISSNGYPLGKVKRKLKDSYRQDRLPGTGVL